MSEVAISILILGKFQMTPLGIAFGEEMRHHPKFGELLTAKEVSDLTGFTMNQLRNWRIPARRQLAPFGYLSIGATPLYRKVVVEAWLEQSGPQQVQYYPGELDERFPI